VRSYKNQDERPETAVLRTLVRLLVRQAAAEQFAAAQQPSSPHDPMKDEERRDG